MRTVSNVKIMHGGRRGSPYSVFGIDTAGARLSPNVLATEPSYQAYFLLLEFRAVAESELIRQPPKYSTRGSETV
jgi:hypothetical protein